MRRVLASNENSHKDSRWLGCKVTPASPARMRQRVRKPVPGGPGSRRRRRSPPRAGWGLPRHAVETTGPTGNTSSFPQFPQALRDEQVNLVSTGSRQGQPSKVTKKSALLRLLYIKYGARLLARCIVSFQANLIDLKGESLRRRCPQFVEKHRVAQERLFCFQDRGGYVLRDDCSPGVDPSLSLNTCFIEQRQPLNVEKYFVAWHSKLRLCVERSVLFGTIPPRLRAVIPMVLAVGLRGGLSLIVEIYTKRRLDDVGTYVL